MITTLEQLHALRLTRIRPEGAIGRVVVRGNYAWGINSRGALFTNYPLNKQAGTFGYIAKWQGWNWKLLGSILDALLDLKVISKELHRAETRLLDAKEKLDSVRYDRTRTMAFLDEVFPNRDPRRALIEPLREALVARIAELEKETERT